ncbi:acyl-CoA synthetase [candidate division TA06 bacterium]|uniref:Acyl-CoA synthetase n=1 Tax=candidate division TA06 bacterium TaxID=2250710 RepID=A0A523UVE1_UNCT6|nr:MAG: acyl-CoA synthetase [candidate division TA06 bacterium]
MKKLRVIDAPETDVGDLFALPSAVAESRIVSPFLMTTGVEDTVIIQSITRKGILAGADVKIDLDKAREENMNVAIKPRAGRGGASLIDTIPYKELVSRSSEKFRSHRSNSDDTACILYTSGTTARPKGVLLTHQNFVSGSSLTKARIDVNETDVIVGVLPFFHVFGLTNVLITGVERGATVILMSRYTPKNLYNAIKRIKATILLAIPTMFVHLLKFCELVKVQLPRTLRYCVSGGAPFPKQLIRQFETTLGTKLIEGYGLTETASAVALNPGQKPKPGSVGTPLSQVEMRVIDEKGNQLPPGEIGEIIIKSPTVTKGYHNLEEETQNAIKGGFFYTGDLGYKDEEGYFYITERKKDIIILGGENISPREIEETLSEHPKVEEAAVIGIQKDERELIKAFVVGNDVTEKELLGFCRERLAPFKVPKSIEFRERLPKSLTGKVSKKELHPSYRDERVIEKEPYESV